MSSTPPDPAPDSSATRKATRRGRTLSEDLRALAATDPTVREAARRLDETLQNIHQVYVSRTFLQCTLSCSGPAPHLREYRAADVRPTAEATATRKAHDAAAAGTE